jgi:glycosyltransferase involved in cell wall biosynthesis
MGHAVALACFQNDDRDVSPMREWCELHTIPFRGRNSLTKIVQGVIEGFPINYVKYRDPRLLATVFRLLDSCDFDVVVVDYSALGWFALQVRKRYPAIPIVTRWHNLDTLIWERWTNSQSNGLRRLLGKTQTDFVRRLETELASVSDLCLLVGASDAELLTKMTPRANVEYLPAGIDTGHYSFQPQLGARDLLFMASSYKWHANSDSVRWLHNEIMPRIWKRHPKTVLYITGSDYTADMQKWTADGRVRLTGFVPDEREIAAKCGVLIVPMRLGAGIKLKVLTALAMGKAVVTTSQGAEGVAGLDDGTHCLIRDSVEGFTEAVGEVLDDDALRRRLAENGRRLVCERYDWGLVSRKFEAALESGVSRSRNSEPASVSLLTL